MACTCGKAPARWQWLTWLHADKWGNQPSSPQPPPCATRFKLSHAGHV
jgi:hypothetical protein